MVKKRERLEVIYDILKVVRDSGNSIKPTRLLYASNLSPQMFKEYIEELLSKEFLQLNNGKDDKKTYSLTEKGYIFLEKYKTVIEMIENFGL